MPELSVSKKTVSKLFSEMQNKKFIIPDYQRPYKWDEEKCETLWNDIVDYSLSDAKDGSDYFLGTLVTFANESKNPEVIDGQQRITSLLLLLRAFYKKLEDMPEDEDVIGLKNQIAPCIWDINPISQKIADKSRIHIESLVVTESDNKIFHDILETGYANPAFKDFYSVNYLFFKEQCDNYAKNNPMQWKQLCINILHNCVVLPIECDTPETALTIFSTLNDRGLPLEDSDIFKAQIYRNSNNDEERKEFTSDWKELSDACQRANVRIDDIFRFYSHVIRATKGDKTKEVGLRKFYSDKKYEKLKATGFMDSLLQLSDFWLLINSGRGIAENGDGLISKEARKYLHCLSLYPNEFWKYPVSVFYDRHKDSSTFSDDFCHVLKKLMALLFAKFIETPTVNAIKDDIYAACISLVDSVDFTMKYEFNEALLKQQIGGYSTSKLSRSLHLLDAYLNPNQQDLILSTFDIEHILPKKWQNTNYNGWTKEAAEQYLETFGNKVVIEKKLNVLAGNGYFRIKKGKYQSSHIENVKDLSRYHKDDWLVDDIVIRDDQIKTRIISFIKEQLLR